MLIYKQPQKIYILTVLSILLSAYGSPPYSSEAFQGYAQKSSQPISIGY